jgi:inhibitor of KinA sporulation pathway (predicted exonuclease)
MYLHCEAEERAGHFMDYIVLDLEWNQCPYGKEKENPRLPFEILEIGAIKMTETKEIIGTFQETICPVVYRQLHFRTKEIVDYSMEELKTSRKFPEVIRDFFAWCGDDYMLCTWGPSDLPELQRNLDFHRIENPLPKPLFYYDVQKLFSILYDDGKVRRSLEHAVEDLRIEKTNPFHRAFDDTYYTAEVMMQMNWEAVKAYRSVDYYRPPENRKEEIYMIFADYAKFVSKMYHTKEELMADRTVLATRCYLCGKVLRRQIKWFPAGQKQYLCTAYCPRDGYLKGKIRIKKAPDGRYFAVRTIKQTTEEQAAQIAAKKEEVREKNRERRKRRI